MIHVLHVDDDHAENYLLQLKFKNRSGQIQLSWVESAEAALNAIRTEEIDCLLCDYQMPGMDGLELLKTIRAEDNLIPFIFLTGQGNEELAIQAFREGADDYFTKEVGFAHYDRLINSISHQVQHHLDRLEKVNLESLAQEQENNYRLMFENVNFALALHKIILGDNGKPVDYLFIEVNDTFEQLTGMERDKVIGKKYTEVFPSDHEDEFNWIEMYGAVALGRGNIHFEQYSQNLRKWWDISAWSPEPHYFVTSFTDITARKNALENLIKSEAKFRSYIEFAPIGVFVVNDQGEYIDVNPAACEMAGYSRDEFLNLTIADLILPGEKAERDIELFESLLAKGSISYQTWLKRKDGSSVYVQLDAAKMNEKRFIGYSQQIPESKAGKEE